MWINVGSYLSTGVRKVTITSEHPRLNILYKLPAPVTTVPAAEIRRVFRDAPAGDSDTVGVD